MPVPICRHIRLNGVRCGSPALRGENFCYYHDTMAAKHRPLNPPIPQEILESNGLTVDQVRHPWIAEDIGYKPQTPHMFNFPALEDRDSIQLAISMVVTALGEYRVEPKLATPILYGLQLALANLRRHEPTTGHTTVTDTTLDADGRQIALDEAIHELPLQVSKMEQTLPAGTESID